MPTTPTGQQQAALTPEQQEALFKAHERAHKGLYDAERDYARTVAKVAYDFHNDLKGAGIDPAQYPAPSSRLGYYAPQQPANADTRAQEAAHDDLATGYARYEFSRRAAAGDDSHACAAGERDGGRVGAAGGT